MPCLTQYTLHCNSYCQFVTTNTLCCTLQLDLCILLRGIPYDNVMHFQCLNAFSMGGNNRKDILCIKWTFSIIIHKIVPFTLQRATELLTLHFVLRLTMRLLHSVSRCCVFSVLVMFYCSLIALILYVHFYPFSDFHNIVVFMVLKRL